MLDFLDKLYLLKTATRQKLLYSKPLLYLIISIRYFNRSRQSCNNITLFKHLRAIKHSSSLTTVRNNAKVLIDVGYIIGSQARNPTYHITEAGKQALSEFNQAINNAQYKYRQKDRIVKKIVPKLF